MNSNNTFSTPNLGATTYTKSCDFETVCETSDTNLISYSIDTNDKFYISNWIEQLDMYCTPKKYIGALGACAFLGAALACFFLPAFGDKYGRFAIYLCCNVV